MNDTVLQQLDSGLLTNTMNRPDRRNALNPEMTRGLVEAARRAAEDHEVRAVLLKGAGGTFCVGGDVKSMAAGRAPLPFETPLVETPLFETLPQGTPGQKPRLSGDSLGGMRRLYFNALS